MLRIDSSSSAPRRDDDVSLAVNQCCVWPLEHLLPAVNPDVGFLKELAADNKVVAASVAEDKVGGEAMAVQYQVRLKMLIHLPIWSTVVPSQRNCFHALDRCLESLLDRAEVFEVDQDVAACACIDESFQFDSEPVDRDVAGLSEGASAEQELSYAGSSGRLL